MDLNELHNLVAEGENERLEFKAFTGQRTQAAKTVLKADINQDAWDSLNSDTSRPFDKPESGRIAVKVINHLGDEVMKVFHVM